MFYYFAPLEGVTDSIYRKLHNRYFPGIHRYYMPFLSPTTHRELTPREQRELPKADTLGYACIPQMLTKVPEDFIWMATKCQDLGYKEVNLNLGCPSGTVTAKGKGSGMLRNLDDLDRFLEQIFLHSPIPISIKTRSGFSSSDEFPALLDIYNRYPLSELTIHPRPRSAFYKGDVDMNIFRYALSNSRAPLCYNGNLCTKSQLESFISQYPRVNALMIGRGLIGDPGMLSGTTTDMLQNFHNDLLEEYQTAFGSARNAMFRLKENWRHFLCLFEGSEKLGKQLRKTTDIVQYKQITHQIFTTLPRRKQLHPDW